MVIYDAFYCIRKVNIPFDKLCFAYAYVVLLLHLGKLSWFDILLNYHASSWPHVFKFVSLVITYYCLFIEVLLHQYLPSYDYGYRKLILFVIIHICINELLSCCCIVASKDQLAKCFTSKKRYVPRCVPWLYPLIEDILDFKWLGSYIRLLFLLGEVKGP